MPPMLITEADATKAHLDAARAAGGAHDLRRFPLNSAGSLLLGSGLIAAAFKFMATAGALPAVIGGVTGLLLLVVGGLGVSAYLVGLRVRHNFISAYAPVLQSRRVVIIEIEAQQVLHADSIDDDADALVLTDGHGGGIYINSHRLFEVAPSDHDAPTHWRLVLTDRDGLILDLEAQGPKIPSRPGPSDAVPFDFEGLKNPIVYEVVILPRPETSAQWRTALAP